MVDIYLKNAQYGYSWVLPYVASGKRQSCLLDNLYLEQDVYNLKEKMVPLSSSFTTSSNPSDEGGRPPLDTREKSDKTIENIESKWGIKWIKKFLAVSKQKFSLLNK